MAEIRRPQRGFLTLATRSDESGLEAKEAVRVAIAESDQLLAEIIMLEKAGKALIEGH